MASRFNLSSTFLGAGWSKLEVGLPCLVESTHRYTPNGAAPTELFEALCDALCGNITPGLQPAKVHAPPA